MIENKYITPKSKKEFLNLIGDESEIVWICLTKDHSDSIRFNFQGEWLYKKENSNSIFTRQYEERGYIITPLIEKIICENKSIRITKKGISIVPDQYQYFLFGEDEKEEWFKKNKLEAKEWESDKNKLESIGIWKN